jgi:hypothetical protein
VFTPNSPSCNWSVVGTFAAKFERLKSTDCVTAVAIYLFSLLLFFLKSPPEIWGINYFLLE